MHHENFSSHWKIQDPYSIDRLPIPVTGNFSSCQRSIAVADNIQNFITLRATRQVDLDLLAHD